MVRAGIETGEFVVVIYEGESPRVLAVRSGVAGSVSGREGEKGNGLCRENGKRKAESGRPSFSVTHARVSARCFSFIRMHVTKH